MLRCIISRGGAQGCYVVLYLEEVRKAVTLYYK